MSIYLSIGGIDLSGFLTENDYSAKIVPTYDEENSFVNIYGITVHDLTGFNVTLNAKLYEVDNDTACALSSLMQQESVSVQYSSPDLNESSFEPRGISLSLECVIDEVKYWTVEIELYAEIAYSGL
ncbi:MAG: hypothetical protein LIO69_03895 [Oscillospiraceae bacterium]|nr:hypothetical protein [Oscillospiraceae bacterium]